MRPVVSVCIPSYNHEQWLGRAIESVLEQSFRDLEIVVVDDGSPDGSLEIARVYERRHPELVRVLTHPGGARRGIGATLNLAIGASRGEYWSALPSDDEFLPDKLAVEVDFLRSHPDVGFVYGYADLIDERGNLLGDRFGIDISSDSRTPLESLIERNAIPAMTVLARRELAQDVGGVDERQAYNDWTLWVKLAAHAGVGFLPRPLARYRLHGANTGIRIDRERNVERALEVALGLQEGAANIGGSLTEARPRALIDLQVGFLRFCQGDLGPARENVRRGFQRDRALGADPRYIGGWLRRRQLEDLHHPELDSRALELGAERVYRRVRAADRLESRIFALWFFELLEDIGFGGLRDPLRPHIAGLQLAAAASRFEHRDQRRANRMALRSLRFDPSLRHVPAVRGQALESLLGRRLRGALGRIARSFRRPPTGGTDRAG